METLNVTLEGVSPLLMHSARGSNPLDPDVKHHKTLTSKRKKTDEDHEAIALSEWRLALYYDEQIGPYIPTMNIRASLINGAKFNKLGKNVKRSTLVTSEFTELIYQGPRTPDLLLKDGSFIDTRSVKVGQSRLMRNRPIFRQWSLAFELLFDETQIEKSDLMLAFQNAGKLIGIGDFRPECGGQFGRFAVNEN